MHLLFLQLATQSLFACRWGISVGLRLGVRHLAFFLSFFALSSSLITLFLSKKKKNYSFNNDISLLLFLQFARQVSWCRSTNYLALPLLLITFLYEIWNLTFMFCSACNAYLFRAEERCLLRFFTWRLGNICLTKGPFGYNLFLLKLKTL